MQELYKNSDSTTIAWKKCSSHRNLRNLNDTPSVSLIRKWVEKFKETSKTLENPKSGQSRSSRTYESVESVNESIHDDPNFSIHKRANALNVHRSSLHCILHKA